MFDFLKGKNWVVDCDALRCDDICISRISLHALILIPSLHSFWLLVYIPFATFQSKQMFDFLKGKNWVVHCDVLRCDDICISRISLPARLFFSSLHSFWSLVDISGMLRSMIIARLGPSRSTIFNPQASRYSKSKWFAPWIKKCFDFRFCAGCSFSDLLGISRGVRGMQRLLLLGCGEAAGGAGPGKRRAGLLCYRGYLQ